MKFGRRTVHPDDASEVTRAEHNRLAADVSELRSRLVSLLAKLDADAGVTDTNYAATLTPAPMTADPEGVALLE